MLTKIYPVEHLVISVEKKLLNGNLNSEAFLKPQIYKVGISWILWVPGERLYSFPSWQNALTFALVAKAGRGQTRAAGR